MKRFCLYSELKPEKVEDYARLHSDPWPELLEVLEDCHIHHYSISIKGTQLFTYYEYTGEDYAADEARMNSHPVIKRWHTFSKPCFLHHEEGVYYEELTEVFYKE